MTQKRVTNGDREIGQRIRRERRRAGLTMSSVASFSGMTLPVYGDSERGERKILAVEIIEISETLSVDPGVLLGCGPVSVDGANAVLADASARMAEEILRLQTDNGALRDELDRVRGELSDAYRNA